MAFYFNGSVSLLWLKPQKSMKIDPDFRCRFGAHFFSQKSLQGSNFLPKASQSDLKINEISTSKPDFPYFGETLIFNDCIMVLLDFTGPDEL